MLAFYVLLIACSVQYTLQAPALHHKPTSDSPIQLISIRPLSKSRPHLRANRRMPSASIAATSGQVVNIERLRADALQPLGKAASAGAAKKTVRVQSMQDARNGGQKPARRSAGAVQTKPFQRGQWVAYDAGPSPIYYARARSNGLFQVDTLRAFAAAKRDISKSE